MALAKLEATRSKLTRAPRRTGSLILAASFGLAALGLLAYLLMTR